MDEKTAKLKQSKGNIEIEGITVPEHDAIEFLIHKYKDKLGSEAIDSLLYSLSVGMEIYKEEVNGKSENQASFKR